MQCKSTLPLYYCSCKTKLTLLVTAGWQRRSGTPKTPVTASGAEAPGWSVDERAAPEPCRLNGFTLSFHVAEPALAEASLSRDDWLGGEAPELGDWYSFCFEAPVDSVCHNHSINKNTYNTHSEHGTQAQKGLGSNRSHDAVS